MIGIEQWRASIGLYYCGSRKQLTCIPAKRRLYHSGPCQQPATIPHKRQLAPTTVYTCLQTLCIALALMVLVGTLTCSIAGLTAINSRLHGTTANQLLVSGCVHSGNLQRSVHARAILLIMAGDVEQNPGPLGRSEDGSLQVVKLKTVLRKVTYLQQ